MKSGKRASNGLLLGYARVSKGDDQTNIMQVRALRAAGCRRIFEEAASGGRWDRPELHRLLDHLREVGPVAAVLLAVIVPASIVGVWLFSLRHHFDGTHWARHVEWDPVDAALRGSSFLRPPCLLQWVTGNIGFHHVHHASPRVPNYRLEACHRGVGADAGRWVARVAPRAVGRGAQADGHLRRGGPLERVGSVGNG
jgi:fatty acid desaturase